MHIQMKSTLNKRLKVCPKKTNSHRGTKYKGTVYCRIINQQSGKALCQHGMDFSNYEIARF